MTDESWYPLYETLAELNVPAMIHVSTSCNPNVSTLGAHYLHGDTTVFMQLIEGGDLFSHFPALRLVIPHGGGAVPYHWGGRYHGLAERFNRGDITSHVMTNVFFRQLRLPSTGCRSVVARDWRRQRHFLVRR